MSNRRELTGYSDVRSAAPGDLVRFKISTEASTFHAQVTRLVHGDRNPAGPGFKEEAILGTERLDLTGRRQLVRAGAYVVAPHTPNVVSADWAVGAWIFPTLPEAGHDQGIISRVSPTGVAWALCLDEGGRVEFRHGSLIISSANVIARNAWSLLSVSWESAAGNVSLNVRQRRSTQGETNLVEVSPAEAPKDVPGHVVIAATELHDYEQPLDGAALHFNGKIEAPSIFSSHLPSSQVDALASHRNTDTPVHAGWRLGPDSSMRVQGHGSHPTDGHPVNAPVRAVTSSAWEPTGVGDAERRPHQYAALEFHEDSVGDAQWETDVEIAVPTSWRSGVYCLRTRAGEVEDRIPFVVRPPRGTARSKLAILLPTLTYLAYANERMTTTSGFDADSLSGLPPKHDDLDEQLADHPEWGVSLYDAHCGGVGCSLVSWLRPIPNLRPDYRMWLQAGPRGLGADLYLIDWLDAKGFEYEVVTDEDLHHEGQGLLDRYDVVLTGSHPEYWTASMMSAAYGYTNAGGRLVYLGGNGFYWVTSLDPDRPDLMEVRRGQAGTRSWESRPGETDHGTTGEQGGLWKHRGMAPNTIVGVGFAAQGWDEHAVGYIRTPSSHDPRVSFAFDGILDDEVIGDFGLIMNGSVGDEVDRADFNQGTPAHALVVATSQPLSKYYLVALENLGATIPHVNGQTNPDLVRADMTFFETSSDGAVFSMGSINWLSALSHHDYQNNASRLTENVIRRFLRPGPLTD